MKLTDEQQAIVACKVPRVLVRAAAGCAKTTTLVEYARARPEESFLYVAYNSAIAKAAATKFPSNVQCKTAHGMAWQVMVKRYGKKLGDFRAPELAGKYGWPIRSCWAAAKTLKNFLNSADKQIVLAHLPKDEKDIPPDAVSLAKALWKRMIDPNDELPISHDGYLKLFQLELGQNAMRRRILFDEAQDSNPVTASMVASQNTGMVVVGDEFQSIYAWRGAVNAMDAFEVDKVFTLAQSFRYGDDIALLASKLLQDWRGNDYRIRGLDRRTQFQVDRRQPHTAIFRTNGGMYAYGIQAMSMGTPYGFIGGVDERRLDFVRDVFRLFNRERDKVRTSSIRAFWNYQDYRDYAKQMGDPEDALAVRLVDEYRYDIPMLLDQLVSRAQPVNPAEPGDLVALVTAHRSKGLEFDRVVLHDDFSTLEVTENELGELEGPDPQEVNLHYVAMTRARYAIDLSPQLRQALDDPPPEEFTETLRGARAAFVVGAAAQRAPAQVKTQTIPADEWGFLARLIDQSGERGEKTGEVESDQAKAADCTNRDLSVKSWSDMSDDEKAEDFRRRQMDLFGSMPKPKFAFEA